MKYLSWPGLLKVRLNMDAGSPSTHVALLCPLTVNAMRSSTRRSGLFALANNERNVTVYDKLVNLGCKRIVLFDLRKRSVWCAFLEKMATMKGQSQKSGTDANLLKNQSLPTEMGCVLMCVIYRLLIGLDLIFPSQPTVLHWKRV